MRFPRLVFLLFWIINVLFLWGCVNEGTPKKDLGLLSEQGERILVADASWVPQTLEAAPRKQATESATPEVIDSLLVPTKPKLEPVTPQQALASKIRPTNLPLATNSSTQLTGRVFGEFPGVRIHWKERTQQLTIQLQEHERKKEELTMKLQLIEQVAEDMSFTTKAYVVQESSFLMEFTIENRASFALKDISITCDQIAPTGTIIQSHTETIYAIIQPSTRSAFSPIHYGNKHRQTQSLQCQIINFTVH